MKLLFDFFPIILFFITYQFYGIYIATGVVILSAIAQLGYVWFRHKKIDTLLLVSNLLVILLGSMTLLLHNDMFIKWKPTVIYWLFALAFFLSEYLLNKESLVKRLLNKSISLSPVIWHRLNLAWISFFSVMGAANLFVVYHYSTQTWVNFKLFGTLGLTLIFILLQSIYLMKHLESDPPAEHPDLPDKK